MTVLFSLIKYNTIINYLNGKTKKHQPVDKKNL